MPCESFRASGSRVTCPPTTSVWALLVHWIEWHDMHAKAKNEGSQQRGRHILLNEITSPPFSSCCHDDGFVDSARSCLQKCRIMLLEVIIFGGSLASRK